MSLIPTIAVIVVAVVIVVIAGSAYSRRRYGSAEILPPALRVISLGLAVAIAGILAPAALREDDTIGALSILVVPVLAGLAAVSTDLLRRGQAVMTTLSAVLMLSWGILTGLGPGFYFIIPSIFMIAAAAATWYQRRSVSGSTGDPAHPSR